MHPDTSNPQQMLWGINQGSTYDDLRIEHMKKIRELDLPGYAASVVWQLERAQRKCIALLKWLSLKCQQKNRAI